VKFHYRGIQSLAPRIDNDRPMGAQFVQMQAHCLAQAPPDAVAHHGIAESARQSEADAGTAAVGFADTKRREDRSGMPGTLVVNSSEVLGT